MKKHILVVASTFPSSDDDPVPAFVKDQIIAMKKVDPELRFSVLAPHDGRSHTQDFSQHQFYDEYRFHYFWPYNFERLAGRGIMPALKANPLNYLLIPFLFIGEFFSLLRLTVKLKPDILYAHWFTPQALTARQVSVFTKTPFVFTTHASDVDVWKRVPLVGPMIVRNNAKKAKAFTAVSRRSFRRLEQFFSPDEWVDLKKRGAIIPMGVTLPETDSTYTSISPKKLLFVGRLVEKKGVKYLLDAFSRVLSEHKETYLTIAGDGPLRASLEQYTKTIGMSEHVSFVGYVSGDSKTKLIQEARLYIVPSIITKDGDAEGLPVSLIEGLAYGKICIATNESGADDIITSGKDGFLVPERDVDSLSSALVAALRLDERTTIRMSEAAKDVSRQFSWDKIALHHIDHLFK